MRSQPKPDRPDHSEPFSVPNYVRLANIRAVVEVVPGPDGAPSEELLWTAYRASWTGVIALALNGVAIAAVDRAMDRIVPYFPLSIPGVVYVDARNDSLLAWVLAKSDLIVGQTRWFQRRATRCAGRLISYSLWPASLQLACSSDDHSPSLSSQAFHALTTPRDWADVFNGAPDGELSSGLTNIPLGEAAAGLPVMSASTQGRDR